MILQGHSDAVDSVAFNPQGTLLVSASDDATARVWDAHSGTQLLVLRKPPTEAVATAAPIETATFSADGSEIVTAGQDGHVRIWSTRLCGSLASLEQLARSLVTRPFTAQEHRTYLAGIGG